MQNSSEPDWGAYNAGKENEKAKFPLLLHELCNGITGPLHTFGRPAVPLADVLFAMVLKVYNRVSCRTLSSDLEMAHKMGLISKVPRRNTVHNYLEMKTVTPYLRQLVIESSLPLREVETIFAIDSTGFSSSRTQRWVDRRYGKAKVRDKKIWVKLHLMCGVKTNIVTAALVSDANKGDSPYFKPLFKTTCQNFRPKEVIGDKAYCALKNMLLAWENGALPLFPFKSNARAEHQTKNPLWTRLYHFYSLNVEWFERRYHKRSNVESTISMIKRRFNDYVLSRTNTAMTNEVLCKVICHNLVVLVGSIYELGLEPEFWAEEKQQSRAS